MIRASIRVTSNDLPRIRGRVRSNMERHVNDTAERIRTQWAAGAPTRTGAYRASVTATSSGLSATVEATATRSGGHSYPVNQEYGTRRHGAQPAAQPAAEGNRVRFAQGPSRLVE